MPTKDDCPVCGQTMFKKSGKGFNKPFCINPECSNFLPEDKRGYRKKAEDDAAEKKPAKTAGKTGTKTAKTAAKTTKTAAKTAKTAAKTTKTAAKSAKASEKTEKKTEKKTAAKPAAKTKKTAEKE